MSSYLAADRFLIQAKDGDNAELQRTAHVIEAIRGTIIAVILFALAWPIALLFGLPEVRWAFCCLAIVPLLNGFIHLDPKRLHRNLRFGPDASVLLIAKMGVLLLAWPLGAWLRDYSAMLWLLITQVVIGVVLSHLVAERKYRWGWNPVYIKRILVFGWPLALDGLLMYGILQGDRFIIGGFYTMTDLAIYSIAFGLALLPTLIVVNVTSGLLLPSFARVQDDQVSFERSYRFSVHVLGLVGAILVGGLILAGPRVVVLFYGSQYSNAGYLIALLATMNAIRLIRVPAILAALSKGDSKSPLIANLARSTALIGAIVAATLGLDLFWIIIAGIIGEVLAVGVAIYRVARLYKLSVRLLFWPVGSMLLSILVAQICTVLWVSTGGWTMLVAVCSVFCCFFTALGLWYSRELRREAIILVMHTIRFLQGRVFQTCR